jgi:hypothetical protein
MYQQPTQLLILQKDQPTGSSFGTQVSVQLHSAQLLKEVMIFPYAKITPSSSQLPSSQWLLLQLLSTSDEEH